jgi:hypothetical protein
MVCRVCVNRSPDASAASRVGSIHYMDDPARGDVSLWIVACRVRIFFGK